MARTSNSFWKDKRNVKMRYTASGDDRFSYRPAHASTEKHMNGKNLPVPTAEAVFSWQGAGVLRLFTAKWEIVGFHKRMTEDVRSEWMVTFQHATMFTSPAVNVACRSKDGLDENTVKIIDEWLGSLGGKELENARTSMYTVL